MELKRSPRVLGGLPMRLLKLQSSGHACLKAFYDVLLEERRVQRHGSLAGVNQLSPAMAVQGWQRSRGPRAGTTLPGQRSWHSASPHRCAKGNAALPGRGWMSCLWAFEAKQQLLALAVGALMSSFS